MVFIILVIVIVFLISIFFFLIVKIIRNLNQSLDLLTQQVNERLKETNFYLESTQRNVGERLDSATKIFGDLKLSLGKLEESYRQIYAMAKEISSLEDLLRAPKFRGELGETLLEKVLEDMLPKEFVRFQYRFRNAEKVDAVIIIGKTLLCIDAKFPLDNFKKYSEAETEVDKKNFYRAFARDVKNRIDEIASKYIVPQENTFDFAFMYVPAEAIYYHLIQDSEISSYARERKIIFVSPNTLYAYLEAVLFGLKGITLQTNIRKVFMLFSQLQQDLKRFEEDFNLLGNHLVNATKKYNEARTELDRFSYRLNVTDIDQIDHEQGGNNSDEKPRL